MTKLAMSRRFSPGTAVNWANVATGIVVCEVTSQPDVYTHLCKRFQEKVGCLPTYLSKHFQEKVGCLSQEHTDHVESTRQYLVELVYDCANSREYPRTVLGQLIRGCALVSENELTAQEERSTQ